jgi:hypothetical protein
MRADRLARCATAQFAYTSGMILYGLEWALMLMKSEHIIWGGHITWLDAVLVAMSVSGLVRWISLSV